MQIFVNDQELDAELTGEQTLEEVYKAVSSWIADHRRYILGMRVDDQEIAISGLEGVATNGVGRVDFYVGDELDMVLSTLHELDRYVDQIGSTLFELDTLSEADAGNLKEGLDWIRQILTSFSSIINMDLSAMSVLVPGSEGSEAIDRVLSRLEQRAEAFTYENDRTAIDAFLEDLRSFKFFVMKLSLQLRTMNARTEELVDHVNEFEKDLPGMVKEIISINESFGAGRDATALETLDSITDRLNGYMSTLFALDYQLKTRKGKEMGELSIGDRTFHALALELTSLLKDLSEALEENDIVAAGDILEYELTEKLETLKPYLSEIRQLVLATK